MVVRERKFTVVKASSYNSRSLIRRYFGANCLPKNCNNDVRNKKQPVIAYRQVYNQHLSHLSASVILS